MEESLFDAQNPLNCPICLDILHDPVTTSCGHSFCMNCIKKVWDREIQSGVCSCPNCRQTFNQRPTLNKSTVLADIVKGVKNAPIAGPGDEGCDVCRVRKRKAIKSCLVCLASYCQIHVKPHYASETFKKHKLVEPGLQQQICSQHHRALEIYCQDDRKCICVLCTGEKHRGHRTISAATEMVERQKELKIRRRNIKDNMTNRRKKMEEFGIAMNQHKFFALETVKETDKIFTEMINTIKERQAVVRAMVTTRMKQEVAQAKKHIQTLNTEIHQMQEEDDQLEPLLQTEDYNYFFQNNSFTSGLSLHTSPSKDVRKVVTFENVRKSVSELKTQLEEACVKHKDMISQTEL
ncbi:E3 ubiquitin/ISG15 ligase TRIM25-like isoform X2 [Triplophysa dalaica]|uniref:E3 ubiquitin/ISG15 ligase TRIM25-like isoform X2 n=1 Tax=Triplophysa dalaica TaxID=1582913 RepID=UPI0024E00062|nr:E3 ubiquitin/ISG15 ligase TRIM25-like isoform X2 [Triplophysa dalaica]